MAKYQTVSGEEPFREARRRSPLPRWLGLAALSAAAPLLYEAGLLTYARWRSMTGAYWEPRTPILDYLGSWFRDAGDGAWRGASRALETGPMNPSLAVPLGIVWAAGMALLFLRKTR